MPFTPSTPNDEQRARETAWDELARLIREPAVPEAQLVFAEGDGERRRIAADVADEVQVLAAGLHHLGVRPGQVVGVQLPTSHEAMVTFAAVLQLRATLLPITDIYGPRELAFVLRDSGAGTVVLRDGWRRRAAREVVDALSDLPALQHVIVVRAEEEVRGAHRWEDVIGYGTSSADQLFSAEQDTGAPALLLYTSGTTATPKGVQHGPEGLLAELRSLAELIGEGPDARPLEVFPAGHIAGVIGLLRGLTGTSGVYLESWDARRAAHLVDSERLTFCSGAPLHLTMLLDAAEQDGRDLTSLTGFMTGAATVPPALVERADALGVATYRCYGSTEHPTLTSGRPSDPLDKRVHTDGRPLAGNEIRIVDDAGEDVAEGSDGEVVSRGPELFLGYRDPALNTDAFLPGGWFRTGDIGHVDGEGFLSITDRKKDVIIRGGENISSREVEDVLEAHPAVLAAAAVAEQDQRYGERVCAFVVLRSAAALDLDDVRRHFRESGTAVQKTPERLVLVDDLPRTPSGKVMKAELRQRLREEGS